MAASSVRLAFVLVMAIAVSASAQRDTPRSGSGTGIIRGTVVAGDTMTPIYDATVSLRSADDVPPMPTTTRIVVPPPSSGRWVPTVRADANGRFEFVDVAPGRYRLAADPGPTTARYLPVRFPDPALEDPTPIVIGAGDVRENLVVALPRAATITGRVVDDRGNGMAWVSVSAQEVLPGERRRLMPFLSTRTDDTGLFKLFGVHPGEYLLTATATRPPILASAPMVASSVAMQPPMYYPGVPSPAGATRIRLGPGEEFGPVLFPLDPVRLSKIRGVLLDATGQPAPTVSIAIRPAASFTVMSGNVPGHSTSRGDGTFELTAIPPGNHVISVNHYGPNGSLFASVPITVADDVDALTIHLKEGVSVSGRIVFEGNGPVPTPAMHVRALPTGGVGNASGVMPAADLSFTLTNQFGPTLIRMDGPAGWHLKSVLHGGRDVTDHPVEFAHDGPALQVVLAQRAAALTGTVVAGARVAAESTVVLFSEDPALWHERASTTRMTATSSTGTFRLDGLRAGRYLVVAITREEVVTSAITSGYFEFLSKDATTVVIGEAEIKTVELKRITLR